jgi:DNA-binding GntR family transcriptional regulator
MPREHPAAALDRLAGPAASLADQAVAAIRAAVRDGTLQPGQLYSAYQIAGYLGVSRSPVREALMRLAEAGMVAFERNRGFRIVIPGAADIAEVFQLRLLLEVPAARRAALLTPAGAGAGLGAELAAGLGAELAAGLGARLAAELALMRAAAEARDEALFMRHDQRLHRLILEAAGNSRLTALVENLRDTTRTLGASTADRSRDLSDIAAEHVPIVDAIAAGDAAAAGAAMTFHLSHTATLLVAQAGGDLTVDQLWAVAAPAGEFISAADRPGPGREDRRQ